MRIPYFLTGVLFLLTAWGSLIRHWGQFEPIEGVAFAFWGALSVMALFGLRYPLQLLPLLLLQFGYKAIWIAAIGYPLLARDELDEAGAELFQANVIGLVIDMIAIPWIYVFRHYLMRTFRRTPSSDL